MLSLHILIGVKFLAVLGLYASNRSHITQEQRSQQSSSNSKCKATQHGGFVCEFWRTAGRWTVEITGVRVWVGVWSVDDTRSWSRIAVTSRFVGKGWVEDECGDCEAKCAVQLQAQLADPLF